MNSFDAIVPLGCNCQVAQQLIYNRLRAFAYPFDWMYCSDFNKVREVFEADFVDFISQTRLVWTNQYENNYCPQLYDPKWHFGFPHESGGMDVIIDRYKRRTERLLSLLRSDKRILFIRYKKASLDSLCLFDEMLTRKYPAIQRKFIYLEDGEDFGKIWEYGGITAYSMPQRNFWIGSILNYGKLFRQFDFVFEKTFTTQSIFDIKML